MHLIQHALQKDIPSIIFYQLRSHSQYFCMNEIRTSKELALGIKLIFAVPSRDKSKTINNYQ